MTKQELVLSSRLAELEAAYRSAFARFEWVLRTEGESRWAESLLDQCGRIETQISEVMAKLASL